jgi:hypothetical protein
MSCLRTLRSQVVRGAKLDRDSWEGHEALGYWQWRDSDLAAAHANPLPTLSPGPRVQGLRMRWSVNSRYGAGLAFGM